MASRLRLAVTCLRIEYPIEMGTVKRAQKGKTARGACKKGTSVTGSIKSAIQNIATFGDTDIFPYSLERQIFHDRPDLIQDALETLHRDFQSQLARNPPQNIETLAPVGYNSFRWATQIDPLWNAYYLALVIELGTEIEAARIPAKDNAVFAYRFIPPRDGRMFDDHINWHAFMQTSLELAKSYPFVLVCDISDFYARVYHHRVENALKWLKAKADLVKRIVDLLRVFSGTVSYGLPVGGPASRLLAELALNGVDKLLRGEGIRFCRFVDDYRIFCASKEEAYQRLIFLSAKLFNEGLSLQKNKTRIMAAKEFTDEVNLLLRTQVDEENLSEEDRLLRISIRFDPYSATRVEDYKKLKEEVSKVDIVGILTRELEKTRIDPTLTRQAIQALRAVDTEPRNRVLGLILKSENLHNLAPAFPRLMIVIRDLYEELDPQTQDLIDNALVQLIRSGSFIIKIDLNLAYLLQVLRRRSSQEKEELFVSLFRDRSSPLVRREVILAMADWGHNHWLGDLKKSFNALSKWERRCFIVGSYFLTDEGRHWRNHNDSLFDLSEVAVRDWFKERFQKTPTVP